jgi:hypothetical protein
MNEEANKMRPEIKCVRCGRKYPDTILNIEGAYHHHSKYECLDRKSCGRAKRKEKK